MSKPETPTPLSLRPEPRAFTCPKERIPPIPIPLALASLQLGRCSGKLSTSNNATAIFILLSLPYPFSALSTRSPHPPSFHPHAHVRRSFSHEPFAFIDHLLCAPHPPFGFPLSLCQDIYSCVVFSRSHLPISLHSEKPS